MIAPLLDIRNLCLGVAAARSVHPLVKDLSFQIMPGEAYGLVGVSVPPFPQMQEFLEWLWNDRQYVLRKKKWP